MANLNEVARQARVAAYTDKVKQKLARKIIDTGKPEFADLISGKGKPMSSLNGDIILRRDLREDGSLRGVNSISPEDLAALLPDLKADGGTKSGHKKNIDAWKKEGIDILKDVADPDPSEYELTAVEELVTLDIDAMSDYDAKQKLIALKAKLAQERVI